MEYERIDHNIDHDTESINDIIEILMINVRFSLFFQLDLDNININIFIISFGIIQSGQNKYLMMDEIEHSGDR